MTEEVLIDTLEQIQKANARVSTLEKEYPTITADFQEHTKKVNKIDYLGGLQFQAKKKYFPTIAKKQNENENTVVPSTNLGASGTGLQFKGEERRGKDITKSFFMTHVPHAGNWMLRNQHGPNVPRNNGSADERESHVPPAGLNIPSTLKLR